MDKPRDYHSLFERDPSWGNSRARVASVGVASTLVLDANSRRKSALFINISDTPITLVKGPAAILNIGILINPNGSSYEESPDTLGYLWVGQFSAISAGAAKLLEVIEDV